MTSHDFMAIFYCCHYSWNLISKFCPFLAKKGQNIRNKLQEIIIWRKNLKIFDFQKFWPFFGQFFGLDGLCPTFNLYHVLLYPICHYICEKNQNRCMARWILVLCTVVDIGVPPGGSPCGRGGQLFSMGGKGTALTSHTK